MASLPTSLGDEYICERLQEPILLVLNPLDWKLFSRLATCPAVCAVYKHGHDLLTPVPFLSKRESEKCVFHNGEAFQEPPDPKHGFSRSTSTAA